MTHPPSDLGGPDPAAAAEEARLAISTAGLAIPTLRAPDAPITVRDSARRRLHVAAALPRAAALPDSW